MCYISSTYDVDGIRTSKTVNGVTTTYYLNGSQILSQKTGSTRMDFIYDENGARLGLDYNGTRYYYITNLEGDIVKIINQSGTEVVEYTYDGWGVPTVSGSLASTLGQDNPFRFKGYYYDVESGMYYLQSRYYDPVVGRFINADDMMSELGKDVRGYNLFSYCFNNPITMIDAMGNWPEWVNTATKILAVTAIVVTTALVITGTGGIAAIVGLGVACSGATGGYFNEKVGGNFTSGYIGGAISGLTQNLMGIAIGPPGVIVGGSIGSGLGTAITETIDNCWLPEKEKKSKKQIATDAIKSATVALGTSSMTGFMGVAVDQAVPTKAYGLMPTLTKKSGEMMKAFFSAIDDALTYVLTI